ncbi:hypothetical protein BH09PAT4_BH09PAT4_07390 [soil metagenome]
MKLKKEIMELLVDEATGKPKGGQRLDCLH